MIRIFSASQAVLFLLLSLAAGFNTSELLAQQTSTQQTSTSNNPRVVIHTSLGDIGLELYADKSPVSVKNFIGYAQSGFYDGTVFHRVISHFMIQGGGMNADLQEKPTQEPIINEAINGLSNKRGTIAMARTDNPHSATSQFFINVQDNGNLDYTDQNSSRGWGYAVFGKVTSGIEVVDQIRFVETKTAPPYSDVPVEPVLINSVEVLSSENANE